jgi:pimeloyl-ACP methyl ester carboxylesterase
MNIKAPFVFTNEQIRSTFNEKNLAAMSEQISEEPEMKTNIEALRTPEERFAVLPHFPYEPNYIDPLPGFADLRMHYVNEGPKDAEDVYLCLHGEPDWAYLYRKMIPVFKASGARVVAPDFFGFGRSDKPVNLSDYSFTFHRESLIAFIKELDLKNITLVCGDWGGILGLTLPMDMPDRFKRLIVMNTALPVGNGLSEDFDMWKAFVGQLADVPVPGVMGVFCPSELDLMDMVAYAAPFPDARYQAGVRRFPAMVPVDPGMDGVEQCTRAREFLSEKWQGESFMATGLLDKALGKTVMDELCKVIRNCPDPLELPHAGHFVQEAGEEVAVAALKSFGIDLPPEYS